MPCYVSLLICSFIGLSESYQTSLIVDLPLFILYEHMRIIGNPFIPKCQGKNPAILIWPYGLQSLEVIKCLSF
jgi:hypothetical protein